MATKAMKDYAKAWKPPEQRAEEKRDARANAKPKGKR